MNDQTNNQTNSNKQNPYKALLIRRDARDMIDEARDKYNKQTGLDLNYSQFIKHMCNVFMDATEGGG